MGLGRIYALVCITAFATAACSSDSDGTSDIGNGQADVTRICQRLVACGERGSDGTPYTQGICELDHRGWLPLPGCAAQIEKSSCGDIAMSTPPEALQNACFPMCAETTCSGDQQTIAMCTSSGALTYACATICERLDQKYTGICGKSANGQTSTTPKCWCK